MASAVVCFINNLLFKGVFSYSLIYSFSKEKCFLDISIHSNESFGGVVRDSRLSTTPTKYYILWYSLCVKYNMYLYESTANTFKGPINSFFMMAIFFQILFNDCSVSRAFQPNLLLPLNISWKPFYKIHILYRYWLCS